MRSINLLLHHELLQLVLIIHLLLNGLSQEWRDNFLQLREFGVHPPDRDESLVLARGVQLFIRLLMVIVNLGRALVPVCYVILYPLLLLILN